MSLPDTVFIFVLALIIFGPKKLPEIGRQIGRLVGEFRRASNEFKFQIEEELRQADFTEKRSPQPSIGASKGGSLEVSAAPATAAPPHPNLDGLDPSQATASEASPVPGSFSNLGETPEEAAARISPPASTPPASTPPTLAAPLAPPAGVQPRTRASFPYKMPSAQPTLAAEPSAPADTPAPAQAEISHG